MEKVLETRRDPERAAGSCHPWDPLDAFAAILGAVVVAVAGVALRMDAVEKGLAGDIRERSSPLLAWAAVPAAGVSASSLEIIGER